MELFENSLFERLLKATPFSSRELGTLILTAPFRYKDHYIDKRNGRGRRLISQPTKEVKYLQRIVISDVLADLPIHNAAMAYRQGRSIADHAKPHAANRYLLKLDFKDFFPSITAAAISHRLKLDKDYSDEERWILSRILCREDKVTNQLHLSIGAPSSPFISNYILHELDEQIARVCQENQVIYTRYADDLALSSSMPKILNDMQKVIEDLLLKFSYLNLRLNTEKTVNVSKKNKRTLVGLTLANDGATSIGRDVKRLLKAQMHRAWLGNLSPPELSTLKGKLAFTLSIDSNFVQSLCGKYGFTKVSDIKFKPT